MSLVLTEELEPGILLVTMNRPERLNALSQGLIAELIKPILAGTAKPRMGRKPKNWSPIDAHYETIRKDMQVLFDDLGLAA